MHEVVYFDTPGFAEVSRFCLEISGLEWKNTVVNWDGYLELKNKGDLPWGYLPIIRTAQGNIAESNALLRYTGALAGLEPEDLYTRAKVDELVEVINGWREAFTPTFSIEDLDEKIIDLLDTTDTLTELEISSRIGASLERTQHALKELLGMGMVYTTEDDSNTLWWLG